MSKKVPVLGIAVDALTIAQAVDHIIGHATNPHQPAGYVVKPYVEFLDQAATNPSIRQLLNNATFVLADGVAVVWAAAYLHAGPRTFSRFLLTLSQIILAPGKLHHPLPERIAGINFTWPLLRAAAQHHATVFFIGSPKDQTIEATAQYVTSQIPGLRIVGTQNGQVSDGWLETTRQLLQQAKPDIVLVGMGFPLQEEMMAQLAPSLEHGLLIGEGGTFDYQQFGGTRPKAPAGIQRLGLEWLWRLLQEPSRLGRQLAIPRFIWRVWRSRRG
jgi:N-acetylglucosaminyldiphosphoundecaprenol N-acetyl-beta-D-mannosaminyltransferase